MTDPWPALRRLTQARIALGRSGHALPTAAQIDFQLAHAEARDAVHLPWGMEAFAAQLREAGEEVLLLESAVSCRDEYLRRPDKGRRLNDESCRRLQERPAGGADLALIITNGLSSTAVERHGPGLVAAIIAACRREQLTLAPLTLLRNGRVAVSDEIGSLLAARTAVIIVGERPGLSAADSLGIYLTYAPRPGNTDAERNCISNIRPPEGLGYDAAAGTLLYLLREALRRGLSGVGLKDERDGLAAGEGGAVITPPGG